MSTTETRWEGAILEKLTANGERIVLVERDIQELKQDMKEVKTTLQELKQNMQELKQDMQKFEATLQEFKVVFTWLKWIGGVLLMILIALIANAISLYLF